MASVDIDKMKAAFDQLAATFRDTLAPYLASYFNALVANGFTRADALELTVNMQGSMLVFGSKQQKG